MITENINRIGNFTSSEIYKLCSFSRDKKSYGKEFLSYISEKIIEVNLRRCIDKVEKSKSLNWGLFLEQIVFEKLGFEYKISSQDSFIHHENKRQAGSPDGSKKDTAVEVKCPFTLKSFCELVNPLYYGLQGIDAINALRYGFVDKTGFSHSKYIYGENYYWQMVNNASILGYKKAELIVYLPYEEDLEYIRIEADGNPDLYFINFSENSELPFLKKEGKYKDLNIITFEIPDEDFIFLDKRVKEATLILENAEFL